MKHIRDSFSPRQTLGRDLPCLFKILLSTVRTSVYAVVSCQSHLAQFLFDVCTSSMKMSHSFLPSCLFFFFIFCRCAFFVSGVEQKLGAIRHAPGENGGGAPKGGGGGGRDDGMDVEERKRGEHLVHAGIRTVKEVKQYTVDARSFVIRAARSCLLPPRGDREDYAHNALPRIWEPLV